MAILNSSNNNQPELNMVITYFFIFVQCSTIKKLHRIFTLQAWIPSLTKIFQCEALGVCSFRNSGSRNLCHFPCLGRSYWLLFGTLLVCFCFVLFVCLFVCLFSMLSTSSKKKRNPLSKWSFHILVFCLFLPWKQSLHQRFVELLQPRRRKSGEADTAGLEMDFSLLLLLFSFRFQDILQEVGVAVAPAKGTGLQYIIHTKVMLTESCD